LTLDKVTSRKEEKQRAKKARQLPSLLEVKVALNHILFLMKGPCNSSDREQSLFESVAGTGFYDDNNPCLLFQLANDVCTAEMYMVSLSRAPTSIICGKTPFHPLVSPPHRSVDALREAHAWILALPCMRHSSEPLVTMNRLTRN
jgi:hypothetical protein